MGRRRRSDLQKLLDRHGELTARGGPTPDELAAWWADHAELAERQRERDRDRAVDGRVDRPSADVLAVIDYLTGPDGPPIGDDPIHLDIADPDTGMIRREIIVNRTNNVVDLTAEVLADLRSRTPAQGQPVSIEPVAPLDGGRHHDRIHQPLDHGAALGDVEGRPSVT
jgi:hypothetical protein